MRLLALVMAAVVTLFAQRANAATVELHVPRAFGFFVGDLVEAVVDIKLDSGQRLQSSSLPRPGALTTYLDLRSVEVEESGETRWRLRLVYQNQFVALDVRPVHVPQLALTILEGETPTSLAVPGWSFLAAPLREIAPEKRESGADYMRPDMATASLDESALRLTTMLLAAAAFVAFAFYLHDRALWPFHERKARIFAVAARRIETLARNEPAPEFLRQSYLALHRSIDQKTGQAVHYEDVDEFLDAHPEFGPAADPLQKFFEASRAAFFDGGVGEPQRVKAGEVRELARRLAALERAAP